MFSTVSTSEIKHQISIASSLPTMCPVFLENGQCFVNPPSGIYRENFQYSLGSLSVLQVTINEVLSYECPSIWM